MNLVRVENDTSAAAYVLFVGMIYALVTYIVATGDSLRHAAMWAVVGVCLLLLVGAYARRDNLCE